MRSLDKPRIFLSMTLFGLKVQVNLQSCKVQKFKASSGGKKEVIGKQIEEMYKSNKYIEMAYTQKLSKKRTITSRIIRNYLRTGALYENIDILLYV